MKKKIIFFLLPIIISIAISEIVSYRFLVNRNKTAVIAYNNILGLNKKSIIPKPLIKYVKVTEFDAKKDKCLRPVEYRDKSKPPIILFGCSYTEGFGLEENETLSRKLADFTNRTIYNRGHMGTGIPFMYYQLNDKDIMEKLPKNTEYVIFTLIPDHFPRLFRYRNFVLTGDHTLKYKIKNNKLVRDKLMFPFIHSLYTSIIMEEYIANKKGYDVNEVKPLAVKLFEESYKIIHKKFPNAKFIIMYYQHYKGESTQEYDEIIDNIKNINKDNIEIIYINDLLPELYEKKYWLEDNSHPSAAAWDIIVPVLSEKLGL